MTAPASAGLTTAGLEWLHAAAERHVGDEMVPGLVALVARGGQVHAEALGSLAVGGPPVARVRRMDGPLADTVPAARAITIRDLLTFTFGFGMVGEMFAAGRGPITRRGSAALPGERLAYRAGTDRAGVRTGG